MFTVFSVITRQNPFIADKGKYLSCPPPNTDEKNESVDGILAPVLFVTDPSTGSLMTAY